MTVPAMGPLVDNGAVEYLGRRTISQKCGQRIELGEIDRVMALPDVERRYPRLWINQAVATGGDARSVGGLSGVAIRSAVDTSAIQAQLRETLPPYGTVVPCNPQLPLSANGKLDRKALPLPELKANAGRVPKAAVKRLSPRQSSLLAWTQDADADFALGGHSLLAMKLAQKSRQLLVR